MADHAAMSSPAPSQEPTSHPDPGFVIIPGADADRERVAGVLASAFASDEHTTGLLPAGRRQERLALLFGGLTGEALSGGGQVWLATDTATDELLGVAVWQAPGTAPKTLAKLTSLPAYLRAFGPRILDAARSDESAHRHRPRVPHWYLKAIGTVRPARGRGVGSALIAHRLSVADAHRDGAYLESSSVANISFYRRHGFRERSAIPAYGTIPTTGMWRVPGACAG